MNLMPEFILWVFYVTTKIDLFFSPDSVKWILGKKCENKFKW